MNDFKITYLFLFIVIACNSPKKNYDDFTCEEWKEEAEADFEEGKLMLIDYGMPDEMTDYVLQVKEKYGIRMKTSYGCIVNTPVECYNDYMYPKIQEKLGDSIWVKIRKEALALFIKENNYNPYDPPTPYFVNDSIIKYSPDTLYYLNKRFYPETMSRLGFDSSRGIDDFYFDYSQSYMDIYGDSLSEKAWDLDNDLDDCFWKINWILRCINKNDTLLEGNYGHVRWFITKSIIEGDKNGFVLSEAPEITVKENILNYVENWKYKYSPDRIRGCLRENEMPVEPTSKWVKAKVFEMMEIFYGHGIEKK